MKCWRCGTELTEEDAPYASECARCQIKTGGGDMSIIEFNTADARKGLAQMAARTVDASKYLAALSSEIDGAKQSLKANRMIAEGYCGAGLKAEIACANRLPEHIANAGKIVQAMIVDESDYYNATKDTV